MHYFCCHLPQGTVGAIRDAGLGTNSVSNDDTSTGSRPAPRTGESSFGRCIEV